MLENENIIWFASVDWSHVPIMEKHVPSRLARKNKVLFVETIGTRPPALNLTHLRRIKRRLLNWFKGIKDITPPVCPDAIGNSRGRLLLYSPILIPGWFPFISTINKWLLAWKIKKLIKKFNLTNPILWFMLPTPEFLIGKLGEKLVVYACIDEWSTYPGGINQRLQTAEDRLLRKSNIVFAVSQPLVDKKKQLNSHTYYLPHGSDFEHFNPVISGKGRNERGDIPDDMAAIKRPILAVTGAVAVWMDWVLIKYLAETRPDWSIVFIGAVSYNVDTKPVQNVKNIYFLGQKKYDDLPAYYRAVDVFVIPFVVTEPEGTATSISSKNSWSEHIKYCNPTRLYEYLSNGKPVVSADFSSAREIPENLIKIAQSKEEWIQLIEQSLKENNPELVEKRKRVARENTWDRRVEQISEILRITNKRITNKMKTG